MALEILSLVMDIFHIISLHIFFDKILGYRHKKYRYLIMGWGSYFVTFNTFHILVDFMPQINSIISIVLTMVIVSLLYSGNARLKVVYTMFMHVLIMLSEVFVMIIIDFGLKLVPDIAYDMDSVTLTSIVSKVFLFLIIRVIVKIAGQTRRAEIKWTDWLEIFLVPIGSVIILWDLVLHINGSMDITQILAVIMILVINISTYLIYETIQKQAEQQTMHELVKNQNQYYISQYAEAETQWNKMRGFQHDSIHRYNLELSMLRSGLYEQLEKEYTEIISELREEYDKVVTGNVGLDSVLCNKLDYAKSQRIKVDSHTSVNTEIGMENRDVSILLGNLLDNAIEALKELDVSQRKLTVDTSTDATAFYFRISNPYKGECIKDSKGNYLTTKKNKADHGLGLKSVHSIINKYDGSIDIYQEAQEFHVRIVMYYENIIKSRRIS